MIDTLISSLISEVVAGIFLLIGVIVMGMWSVYKATQKHISILLAHEKEFEYLKASHGKLKEQVNSYNAHFAKLEEGLATNELHLTYIRTFIEDLKKNENN